MTKKYFLLFGDKIVFFLFIFVTASIGMSHILVDGNIFNGFRQALETGKCDDKSGWLTKLGKLLHKTWIGGKISQIMGCYSCSGWWSGAFVGLLLHVFAFSFSPVCIGFFSLFPFLFLCGCSASFLSPLGAVILMYFQSFGK